MQSEVLGLILCLTDLVGFHVKGEMIYNLNVNVIQVPSNALGNFFSTEQPLLCLRPFFSCI